MNALRFEKELAIVTFIGKVNFDSIQTLVRAIDEAVNYYQFKRIRVEINSPGGELKALLMFLAKLKVWRSRGVMIETHALSNVASAAAVMLSLGDIGHRTAMADAEVLYHNVRVMGEMMITSEKAKRLNDDLTRIDQKILNALIEHNRQHIEDAFLQGEVLPIKPIKLGHKTLRANQNKAQKGYSDYVKGIYQELFDLDIYLNAEQAVELRLIDEVTFI